jgi:iron complex transport system ATP-binding protein
MGRLGEKDHRLVELALEEVGLRHYKERQVDRLSDGERQRALIARAFVQETPVMVLDEPTAFLDIPNKYELIRLLAGFRDAGKTILYSTHDLETALMCADKLWVIHDGRIHEGAPEDLGLTGIFDMLFRESGITFHRSERRFRYHPARKGVIRVTGSHTEASGWTCMALERMGFDPGEGDVLCTVKVKRSGSGFRWEVTRDGTSRFFENLYSLARFLIQDD